MRRYDHRTDRDHQPDADRAERWYTQHGCDECQRYGEPVQTGWRHLHHARWSWQSVPVDHHSHERTGIDRFDESDTVRCDTRDAGQPGCAAGGPDGTGIHPDGRCRRQCKPDDAGDTDVLRLGWAGTARLWTVDDRSVRTDELGARTAELRSAGTTGTV